MSAWRTLVILALALLSARAAIADDAAGAAAANAAGAQGNANPASTSGLLCPSPNTPQTSTPASFVAAVQQQASFAGHFRIADRPADSQPSAENQADVVPVLRDGAPERLIVTGQSFDSSKPLLYRAAAEMGIGTSNKQATWVEVLGAELSGANGNANATMLTLRIPSWSGITWWGPLKRSGISVYVVACNEDNKPAYSAQATAQVSSWLWSWIVASIAVLVLYAILAWALSEPEDLTAPNGREATHASRTPFTKVGQTALRAGRGLGRLLCSNPVTLTSDITGRGSLGNLQVLFFTLVTTWIFIYQDCRTGSWATFDINMVAPFLAVSAGTVTSRFMRASDQVSVVNLGWLLERGWVRKASVRDLFMSRGEPDPTRFQAVAVSAVIGLVLIVGYLNDRPDMGSSATILALLGGSQLTYIFGKLSQSGRPEQKVLDELNDKLDAARLAESRVMVLVNRLPELRPCLVNFKERLDQLPKIDPNLLNKLSSPVDELRARLTKLAQLQPLSQTTYKVGLTDFANAVKAVDQCVLDLRNKMGMLSSDYAQKLRLALQDWIDPTPLLERIETVRQQPVASASLPTLISSIVSVRQLAEILEGRLQPLSTAVAVKTLSENVNQLDKLCQNLSQLNAMDTVDPLPKLKRLLPFMREVEHTLEQQVAGLSVLIQSLELLPERDQTPKTELDGRRSARENLLSLLRDVLKQVGAASREAAARYFVANDLMDGIVVPPIDAGLVRELEGFGKAAADAAGWLATELDVELARFVCFGWPLKSYIDAVSSPKPAT